MKDAADRLAFTQNVRLTHDDMQALHALAARRGVTVSALVREAILNVVRGET